MNLDLSPDRASPSAAALAALRALLRVAYSDYWKPRCTAVIAAECRRGLTRLQKVARSDARLVAVPNFGESLVPAIFHDHPDAPPSSPSFQRSGACGDHSGGGGRFHATENAPYPGYHLFRPMDGLLRYKEYDSSRQSFTVIKTKWFLDGSALIELFPRCCFFSYNLKEIQSSYLLRSTEDFPWGETLEVYSGTTRVF